MTVTRAQTERKCFSQLHATKNKKLKAKVRHILTCAIISNSNKYCRLKTRTGCINVGNTDWKFTFDLTSCKLRCTSLGQVIRRLDWRLTFTRQKLQVKPTIHQFLRIWYSTCGSIGAVLLASNLESALIFD